MSKIIKIGIILFIILFITISNVYALDMNLSPTPDNNQGSIEQIPQDNTNSQNNDNQNIVETNEQANVEDDILTPSTTNNQSSLPESNLGLNNILNILLIVVGFVLILLGIAIILRLR